MSTKTALIFGSSGLVGSALLQLVLNDDKYAQVKIFVRKLQDIPHPKLQQIVIDFERPAQYESELKGDHLYLCLGTTMAKAGSKEAFYKVDYTYTISAATMASQHNVPKVALISSMGADVNAPFYYTKVKGQVEAALKDMPFDAIHIVRPSLLLGDRAESRPGERFATWLSINLPWLYSGPFKKYRPIADIDVAKAMIRYMFSNDVGYHIHESPSLKLI